MSISLWCGFFSDMEKLYSEVSPSFGDRLGTSGDRLGILGVG